MLTIPVEQGEAQAEQTLKGVREKEEERTRDEAVTFGQPLYGFLYPFLGEIPDIGWNIDCVAWLMVEETKTGETKVEQPAVELIGAEAVNVLIEPTEKTLAARDKKPPPHTFLIPVQFAEVRERKYAIPFLIAVRREPTEVVALLEAEVGTGAGHTTQVAGTDTNPLGNARYTVTGEMWVGEPEKAKAALLAATERLRKELKEKRR
ncbi:MAG: hypothetical protein A2Z34_07250 [Planctomycetes bacterium RBG_16_59_8]|nr:MAG: hypothetical protein A2Z34_07250 [Planctomycetes bacterium RBG_16_59_8]